MAPTYDILQKPPPDDDKKGWSRWFYKVVELLNNPPFLRLLTDTGNSTIPTTPGVISWNSSYGTINVQSDITASVLQVGQETWLRVVNKTGSDVTDGTVVYISGAQGQRPRIGLADADADNQSYVIGLVTSDIAKNAEGFVTTSGLVNGLNTTGSDVGEVWADGDPLWLSGTAGKLTKTELAAPKHSNFVGICVYAHLTQGKIYVDPQLGQELDELHDVKITSPADYQLLVRDQTNGYWKNTANVLLNDTTRTLSTNTNDLNIDCGTEKTVVLTQTVTDDVYPSSVSVAIGATAPSFSTYNGGLRAYEFTGAATDKDLQVGYQLNHTYAQGTDIVPHIHITFTSGAADATKTIIFDLEYEWQDIGTTGAYGTTTVRGTHTIAANNTVYRNTVINFGNIAGAGKKISSTFMTRLVRMQSVDTFGSSCWLLSADIHIFKDTQGSRQPFVK